MSPLRYGNVPRERLLDLIDGPGVAPVTLILAPAGYGKSTVARQWVEHRRAGQFGWYQMHAEHNVHATFLRHLWQAIDDAVGESEAPPEAIEMEHVIKRLKVQSSPVALVLDDYHLVQNVLIHRSVERLLNDLTSSTSILILSRHVPELSLARLSAFGRVRQIAKEDLAFTPDEAKLVFARHRVDDDLLFQLTTHSEGWIAGLQLALMSINVNASLKPRQIGELISSASTSRWLNDYIIEEVLNALPDDLRDFVFDTSVLTTLDPELCDAVRQTDSSNLLLERLEDAIVFAGRPSSMSSALAYHRLFAECVQRLRRTIPGQVSSTGLRLRAAQWHQSRGEFEEASEYALAAESWDLAAKLIRDFIPQVISHKHSWDSLYWLRRLPESVLRSDARLLNSYLTALLANGQTDEARPLIEAGVHSHGFEPVSFDEGWFANHTAVLAYLDGNSDEALHQSYRALSLLPLEAVAPRLLAWSNVYREESIRGHRDVAREALQQAEIARKRQPKESIYWHFIVAPEIANDAAIQGDLARAEKLIHHFILDLPAQFRLSIGKFKVRLLSIYLEQNLLDLAALEVRDILDNMEARAYGFWYIEAWARIADYYLAIGDAVRSLQMLELALQASRRYGGFNLINAAEAGIAHYWLHTGQHELAQLWANRTESSRYLTGNFGEHQSHTIRIRLLLFHDLHEDALKLATGSIELARQCGNVTAEIEFLVWASIAERAAGIVDDPNGHLRCALELGAPGRFSRVFVANDCCLHEAIHEILPALSERARRHAASFASEADSFPLLPGAIDGFAEAELTNREREVLARLVLGKSNREIAGTLSISERTVKKHLANLFRKTGVSSRTALALWGRDHTPDASVFHSS